MGWPNAVRLSQRQAAEAVQMGRLWRASEWNPAQCGHRELRIGRRLQNIYEVKNNNVAERVGIGGSQGVLFHSGPSCCRGLVSVSC